MEEMFYGQQDRHEEGIADGVTGKYKRKYKGVVRQNNADWGAECRLQEGQECDGRGDGEVRLNTRQKPDSPKFQVSLQCFDYVPRLNEEALNNFQWQNDNHICICIFKGGSDISMKAGLGDDETCFRETCKDTEPLASCALVNRDYSHVASLRDFSFFPRGAFVQYMIVLLTLFHYDFQELINVITISLDALQCLAQHFAFSKQNINANT